MRYVYTQGYSVKKSDKGTDIAPITSIQKIPLWKYNLRYFFLRAIGRIKIVKPKKEALTCICGAQVSMTPVVSPSRMISETKHLAKHDVLRCMCGREYSPYCDHKPMEKIIAGYMGER